MRAFVDELLCRTATECNALFPYLHTYLTLPYLHIHTHSTRSKIYLFEEAGDEGRVPLLAGAEEEAEGVLLFFFYGCVCFVEGLRMCVGCGREEEEGHMGKKAKQPPPSLHPCFDSVEKSTDRP